MKRQILALAFPVLSFAGVAQAPESKHIREITDPYSGHRELRLRVATHRCAERTVGGVGEWDMYLDFAAVEGTPHAPHYMLSTAIDVPTALKPRGQAVLRTVADGVSASFTQVADVETKHHPAVGRLVRRYVEEWVPFELDIASMQRVSEAKKFQLRLDTRDGSIERCADAKDLHDLREFLRAASIY